MKSIGERKGTPRMSVMRRNEAIAGYVFMLPLLLGIVFLTYGQFVYSLIISFTDKSVFGTANFVDPAVTVKVANGINEWLDQHGCKSVGEIVGQLNA